MNIFLVKIFLISAKPTKLHVRKEQQGETQRSQSASFLCALPASHTLSPLPHSLTSKHPLSRHMSKFELGTESEIAHYYNDDETLRLVNSMANVIGIPIEEIWEAYGGFLIQFTMETGWDELLRAMAPDLEVRSELEFFQRFFHHF